MSFDLIFIYPFITYQVGRVRAGVPTKAVVNQIFMRRVGAAKSVVTYPQRTSVAQSIPSCWIFLGTFCSGLSVGILVTLWIVLSH